MGPTFQMPTEMVTICRMSEQFTGHDLETGLLQRFRSWRDVLPPIGLLPALRVCGSPLYTTGWIMTIFVIALCVPTDVQPQTLRDLVVLHPWGLAAAILVGLLPAAITMRAGALYAAGRGEASLVANSKWVIARLLTLFLVLVLPVVCVLGLSVPLVVLGLIDRVPMIGDHATEVLSILSLPLIILIGLVAGGSIVAIPVGWASVSIEKRQDAFDALSRGYEYLYRRPVQTAIFLFSCGLLSAFIGGIALCVASAGEWIAREVHALTSGGEALPALTQTLLFQFPFAAAACTFFSTFGAAYLLLRKEANEQEMEDIAVSPIDRRRNEMPTLKGS